MRLIGLMGYAGVGKDTAARHMPGWRRLAFADKLKRDLVAHCISFYGCSPLHATPEQKALIRPVLVAHGRIMRDRWPDWWVDCLAVELKALAKIHPDLCAVITDVRYGNECSWIRGQGGHVILLTREGYGPANEEEGTTIPEAIEQEWPSAVIPNDSTPERLGASVIAIAEALFDFDRERGAAA